MSIFDTLRKKEPFDVIHHVVLVQAPLDIVSSKLSTWFDNKWRSSSQLTFKGLSSGALQVGSNFTGHFKSFWPVNWKAEVSRFKADELLQFTISGFFEGTETVTVEERYDVIKVDYTLKYDIQNPLNQLIWSVFLEDHFVAEVHKALEELKTYCEKAE